MTLCRVVGRQLQASRKMVLRQPSRLTLKMEAASIFEPMLHSYHTTRRHRPKVVILTFADAQT